MSENRVIGRANAIPWHLPADFKFFKNLTMGHTLIMGRKTFDSVGRALPGRRSIVLTRDARWTAPGAETARDLAGALAMTAGETEVFVVGGANVYQQAMPDADRIYLTLVHSTVEGDTFFPEIDGERWVLMDERRHAADPTNEFAMTFQRYERKNQ